MATTQPLQQTERTQPAHPAQPLELPSSRFDGSTGPRIIGPRGKAVDRRSLLWARILCAALAGVVFAGPAFGQARPVSNTSPAVPRAIPGVEDIRRATERFRDVKVALAEGYIPDPAAMCITAEMEGMPRQLGEMGIHYFRPDLLGITGPPNPRVSGTGTHTDFRTPGVLVYEPQPDGSLRLVAVENLVFERAWREAGHTEPPQYAGNAYYHMVDNPLTDVDEAHGFEPHYELHAWLYRENPNGTFAQFNPRATCRHHKHDKAAAAHGHR
jgi:hypothetical protein